MSDFYAKYSFRMSNSCSSYMGMDVPIADLMGIGQLDSFWLKIPNKCLCFNILIRVWVLLTQANSLLVSSEQPHCLRWTVYAIYSSLSTISTWMMAMSALSALKPSGFWMLVNLMWSGSPAASIQASSFEKYRLLVWLLSWCCILQLEKWSVKKKKIEQKFVYFRKTT